MCHCLKGQMAALITKLHDLCVRFLILKGNKAKFQNIFEMVLRLDPINNLVKF